MDNPLDFHSVSRKIYNPRLKKIFIFPSWLNHSMNLCNCSGKRRTAGENKTFGEIDDLSYNFKDKFCLSYFVNGNLLKWKIYQNY